MKTFVIKDRNLRPENIKQGVKIFKVEGTYEGGATEDWIAQLKRHEIQLNGEDWDGQLEDLTNLSLDEYGSMALTAGPDVFDDGYDRVLDYDFTNGGEDATADHGLAYALAGTSVQSVNITVQNRQNAHSCWAGMFYECPDIQNVTVQMYDDGPTQYTDGQAPRLFERFMVNAGGQINSNNTITAEFIDLTWVNSLMFSEAFSNLGYNSKSRRYCNITFPDLVTAGWIEKNAYTWVNGLELEYNQNGANAFYKAFHNCQTKTSSRSGAKSPVYPQGINDIFPSLKTIYGNAVFSHAFEGTNIIEANFLSLCLIDHNTNSGNFGVFEGAFENSDIESIDCCAIYGENADNPDTWRDAFKNTSLSVVHTTPDMLGTYYSCKNMLWGISQTNFEGLSDRISISDLTINIPNIAYEYVDVTDPRDFDEKTLLRWLQVKDLNVPGNVLSYSALKTFLNSVIDWLDRVNVEFGEHYRDPLEWSDVIDVGEIDFIDSTSMPLIVETLCKDEDIQAIRDLIDELTGYGFNIDGIYMTWDEYKAASGGSDWLTAALAGNITDLSGHELPGLSGEGRYSYMFSKTPIVKTPNINGALNGKQIAYNMFSDCSALIEADLSKLTSLEGYNMDAGEYMFSNCTNLVSVDLSGLISVRGMYACGNMFYNCTSLESVDLGSLSNISSYSSGGPFYNMFRNCTNLTDVTIHPKAIERGDTGWNPLETAIYIENLYLTDNATDNIRLDWQPNLTAASVLEVLTHLDLTVSGKSVNFYSSGLTVTDDAQGSIQTAYDAAVAAGWTINNLTIVQP